MRPVAYASRIIQGAETSYASSELEVLGVVWATRHFHHYLYGRKCIVYTDNIALKSLLATPHPSKSLGDVLPKEPVTRQIDGVLFRSEKDGTVKLIPLSVTGIADLHGGVTGAHLGAEETLGHVRTHYWRESIRQDVYAHCNNYSVCRSRKSGNAPVVP